MVFTNVFSCKPILSYKLPVHFPFGKTWKTADFVYAIKIYKKIILPKLFHYCDAQILYRIFSRFFFSLTTSLFFTYSLHFFSLISTKLTTFIK